MGRPAGPWGEGFDEALSEELERPGRSRPYPAPLANAGGEVAVLPGSGDRGLGCGDLTPTHVCWHADPPTHKIRAVAYVKAVYHDCLERTCPRCAGRCEGGSECPFGLGPHLGGKWAHREAFDARDRWEDYLEQSGLSHAPVRQVVVSPPIDRWRESDSHPRVIANVRATAERFVRKHAWRGRYEGSVVVHLYRGCEKDGYDEWGPHAHVTCLGVDVGAVGDYEARTGVVVKQVNGAGGGWASYRGFGLARHICYELGHAAVLPNRPTLVWFGGLKTWSQPEPPRVEKPVPTCPSCRRQMEEFPLGHYLEWGLTPFGPALQIRWLGCAGYETAAVILCAPPTGPPERDGGDLGPTVGSFRLRPGGHRP